MIKLFTNANRDLIANDEPNNYLILLVIASAILSFLGLFFALGFFTDAFSQTHPIYTFCHTHPNICISIIISVFLGCCFLILCLVKSLADDYDSKTDGRVNAIYGWSGFTLTGAIFITLPFVIVIYICIYVAKTFDNCLRYIVSDKPKKTVKSMYQEYEKFLSGRN